MAINLKQILLSDTDNIKLEKVNYNFDQIVANGGGPQGVIGYPGSTGYQGVTGYQGDQGISGDQGFQGVAGDTGEDLWKDNVSSSAKTILPIAIPGNNPPTIAIGYRSTSSFYDSGVESSTSLLINRDGVLDNNLELRTEGSLNAFYYRLRNNGSQSTMQTGFKLSQGDIAVLNQYASEWNWISNGNTLITLDDTELHVNIESDFDEPVTINNALKISGTNSGAADGKIAVSADVDGTVDFKSIDEIGGVVPIGTIVSVDPMFFDSSNFKLEETNVTAPSDAPIEIRVGSGINNFAGWYLCNGQTWNNGLDPATVAYVGYQTDDLNSFSYSIDENPATNDLESQGERTITNNNVSLIGGSNVSMAATYSTPNYNISGTVQTSSQTVSSDSNGTSFVLKRLPQIIYLGTEDLFWQDKGINQAAPATVTYRFTDSNEGAGGLTVINESKTEAVNSSFSFTVNISPASGYEWNSLPTVTSANAAITSVSASNSSNSFPSQGINVTVNVGSQPLGGTVLLTYDSTNHTALIAARTNTYIINDTNADWSISPNSVTVTDTPGDTVDVDEFIITPDNGEYFDKSKTPTLPYPSANGTLRQGDLVIDDYEYRDLTGNVVTTLDTNKAKQLWLDIKDIDFANASAVPGGTTGDTTINIGGISFFNEAPYVGYTTQWTGGNNSWNSTNYNHYSTVSNRTWNIVNNTEEQVNIRLKASEYSGANTGNGLSAQISYQNNNNTTTQFANTGSTAISGGGSSVDYSSTVLVIPAGGDIDIVWNLMSVPSGSSWVASLQYWLGTGSSTNYSSEIALLAKQV